MHCNVRGLLISAFVVAGGHGRQLTAQTRPGPEQQSVRDVVGGSSCCSAPVPAVLARRHYAAVATSDASALYYNPRCGRDDGAARPAHRYLRLRRRDPVLVGGPQFPFGGGSSRHRLPDRDLRLQRSADLHGGPAGRDRRDLLGHGNVPGHHLRPELLRSVFDRHDAKGVSTSWGRPTGRRSRSTLAPITTPSSRATR